MIAPELRARIRRLFFAEHWKVGTIAAELGVHHETVMRAIEADRFVRPDALVRRSLLDLYRAFVTETLEQHPRLRATRLFEMIRDRGYQGSAVQLRRYVATVRPGPRSEAYLRLQTLPGEQAQVDWGHFGSIRIGHAKRTLSCFVMVLSWSRAIFARFALDQTLETFLRGHVEAYSALGGVPRSILYDNLKSVVLERAGDHVRFNEAMLFFAGHYHFAPKPCAPYRGNEKGKVERTIQYLRNGFFAARRYSSVEDLNAQLRAWIDRTAHARKVPGDPEGRLVRDALEEERPRLLPLPEHPWECRVVRSVVSGKQPYIRFDRNDYSIPHYLVGKPLVLTATEEEVRITNGSHVFATHARSYDEKQVIEDPTHIEELAREKRHAHELRGRDRLRASCPSADAFVEPWPNAASTSVARSPGSSSSSTGSAPRNWRSPSRTPSPAAPSAPPPSHTSSTSGRERGRSRLRSTSSSPTIPGCATCASLRTPSTPTTPSPSRRRRSRDHRH